MQPELQEFLLWAIKNKGKIIGVILGLILGWMAIAYGILKTLFVLILVFLGYWLGSRSDREQNLRGVLDSFFSDSRK